MLVNSMMIHAFDHVVIHVTDLNTSATWYQRVLGFEPEDTADGALPTSFRFGQQLLRLRPVNASKEAWFTAKQVTAGSDDLCFLTKLSPEAIIEHLRACDVAVERGPVEQQGGHGRLVSVYCRDPDGSLIEIASVRK
jgi:catechol 2,3-dioxygenase-like lactoylglutathione lyase family enzyme